MKTEKELAEEFLRKFDALLEEYDAEFECSDEFTGYAECGQDIHARVHIPAVWDTKTGERLRHGIAIDLGRLRYPKADKQESKK